jgi:hypothetical protein
VIATRLALLLGREEPFRLLNVGLGDRALVRGRGFAPRAQVVEPAEMKVCRIRIGRLHFDDE